MSKNKIQIPKLILDHLLQYGNTSISGLGTLFYNHHSAYLSDDKLQIFPPSNTLIFKDSIETPSIKYNGKSYSLQSLIPD